jgi:phosphoglycerol transferase MdoB-like AlkP superfamily enzyme
MGWESIDFSFVNFIQVFGIGFLFDIGSLSYVLVAYTIYLLLFPKRFYGSKVDKIFTKTAYALILFVLIFSFLSEITFWLEYQKRFNFIAVDYLLYTYEVIENIHQSYPLPLLVSGLILITYLAIRIAKRKKAYCRSFDNHDCFRTEFFPALFWVCVFLVFHFNIKNSHAEVFENRVENELAKAGLYSFFAAYNSHELDYNEFYKRNSNEEVQKKISSLVSVQGDSLVDAKNSISRIVFNEGEEYKPNVIFIGLESLNATFMHRFNPKMNRTPVLDSLIKESVFFNNLFAVGTRTVRGMEAITLSIPPTPGRSIVRREGNDKLFTIGNVFEKKGYTRTFFYGGDSYFDSMNTYFGNNGFDIVDRKKKHRGGKDFPTKRINIDDNEVTFENAWGVCDDDIYNKVLKVSGEQNETGKPFFNFVMNNSNHQPYTYPDANAEIPSGTSREGAVKYADRALGDFLQKAKQQPWFENTVFVIMSDHCCYSAGRTALNVEKYHIPAYIYNLKNVENKEVNKMCSQIDIFPTLFGLFNWTYFSNIYGQDILKMKEEDERALIGNHRKLGLLKKNNLVVLSEDKKFNSFIWNREKNELSKDNSSQVEMADEAVAYYQSAFNYFKNGQLKAKK